MALSIEALFEEYDGRSVEPFRLAAEVLPSTQATLVELIALASDASDSVEIGASWVVKHLMENGLAAEASVGDELRHLLETLRRDEALLHVLQCLPYLELQLSTKPATSLFETLGQLTASKNAFVRAWAYNGLGLLAGGVPSYRAQVEALFGQATEHETPAVKARIRHASRALAENGH
jgi:hypothetical protein